ncbi:SDR family oxidoreductase [Croceicoccus bisphenolivorans]|uniref:SDR family oxidoreductase n=1 Tax=Croceicoccus bisphenolivorans TaxID=1783232 RepID=UPI00082CC135|nr:SDR family oxidoreductase [Croceicoccus bisphenolivorans]
MTEPTYLVTGASGNLGRAIVQSLLRRGAKRVIATTRSPDSLADLAAAGVEVRKADFNDAEGLVEAFSGATHLLLISTQSVGARVDQHGAALAAAKAAGVQQLFYTSHSFPDTSVSAVAPEHAAMERKIIASGMTYTILRNFLYSENVLLMLAGPIQAGIWHGAAKDGRNAFLSRKDCADADAGAMLAADRLKNMVLDITGPRTYSYPDIARIASEVLDRDIPYVDLSPDEFLEHLVGAGLPRSHAETLVSFDRATSLGDGDLVTPTSEELAGHPLELLEDFLARELPRMDATQTLSVLLDNHLG